MSRHAAARIGRFARCVFCLVTVLAATNTLASTLRPLNLEQLTARAGQIFVGRCVAVDVERDEALGAEVAVLTFRVEVALKGAAQGTVSVRQVGGEQARIVGLPQIEPGEVVLLFLYGTSQAGLSSPVGFGQGTFTVLPDKTGRRFALNEFSNRNLFRGMSENARRALGVADEEIGASRALELDRLLAMVRALLAE